MGISVDGNYEINGQVDLVTFKKELIENETISYMASYIGENYISNFFDESFYLEDQEEFHDLLIKHIKSGTVTCYYNYIDGDGNEIIVLNKNGIDDGSEDKDISIDSFLKNTKLVGFNGYYYIVNNFVNADTINIYSNYLWSYHQGDRTLAEVRKAFKNNPLYNDLKCPINRKYWDSKIKNYDFHEFFETIIKDVLGSVLIKQNTQIVDIDNY